MKIDEKYKAIREAHYRAFNELEHARQEIEDIIGARLRAHQEIILSILVKENGKSLAYGEDPKFYKGEGAWAYATRAGFEVINLTEDYIIIRSITTPEVPQKPVTYKIPKSILTLSNREIAKKLRLSIKDNKDRDKNYRQWKVKSKIQNLERSLRESERKNKILEEKIINLKKNNGVK